MQPAAVSVVACTAALSPAAWAQGAETADATMRQIIRADYQGNREALARLARLGIAVKPDHPGLWTGVQQGRRVPAQSEGAVHQHGITVGRGGGA